MDGVRWMATAVLGVVAVAGVAFGLQQHEELGQTRSQLGRDERQLVVILERLQGSSHCVSQAQSFDDLAAC